MPNYRFLKKSMSRRTSFEISQFVTLLQCLFKLHGYPGYQLEVRVLMADKQLKSCDKKEFIIFLCKWCFYTQYDSEKGEIITTIYYLVCFTKRTCFKYPFYTASSICDLLIFSYTLVLLNFSIAKQCYILLNNVIFIVGVNCLFHYLFRRVLFTSGWV